MSVSGQKIVYGLMWIIIPLHEQCAYKYLVEKGRRRASVFCDGPKNCGSTILLPFGHLQYHLKQLEFYQQLKKIQSLLATVSE